MPACPECGAPYPAAAPETGARWTGEEEDDTLERRLRLIAPPAILVLGFVLMHAGVLGALIRIFDTMWLHELGHAVTAWLSGFGAFPGPWKTSIAETRSPIVTILVLAVLGGLGYWGHRTDKRWLVVTTAVLAVTSLFMTLAIKRPAAQGVILFGGDAGALVFGTALFATFFAPRGSKLQVSWLRWGFIVLGAFGFADIFTVWWRARHDLDVIPFGEIEGVGHSDPTRLVDDHGWSVPALVSRYVTLGVVCIVVMAALYVVFAVIPAVRRSSDRPASP